MKFDAFNIKIVEVGEELEVRGQHGRHETVVITDSECVFVGKDVYMTKVMHELVMDEVDIIEAMEPKRL